MQQSRLAKTLDALSQLANVALLPDHASTNANESISGRSYRCGWRRAERVINLMFWWDADHCRAAYYRDVARACQVVEYEVRRVRGGS
jgi:hypothetical protein